MNGADDDDDLLIDDLNIVDNIDDILDISGDDLMDIEQTAFVGRSRVMLTMINNLISTID